MSIKNIGVLAFASAAAAAGHGHLHARLHAPAAYGTGSSSSVAAPIPTGLPACWSTCFQEAGASSPDSLCKDEKATECIKKTCATEDVASYEAWLKKQCSSAPYPSGSNSTMVGPTGASTSSLPAGYSTSLCTETSTLIYKTSTAYSTYLVTHTLSPSTAGGYGSATSDVPVSPVTESAPGSYGSGTPNSPIGGGEGGSGSGEVCSDVTVTETQRTTVTVTAGEGSSYSSYVESAASTPAPETSSTEGSAEAPSSYVSQAEVTSSWGPPAYGTPSSPAAPESTTSEAAAPPAYETPSWTSEAAPSSYAQTSSAAPSSSPSSPPSYGGSTGFRGKRGIAYNESSMVVPALTEASKIGWAYNWEGISKGFESSEITYIPELHSSDSYWTSMWTEQAEAAIAQGLPYLFGPNEPDIPSQANMSPEECANFWREWMEPYAGRIKLVAPAVSSGVGPDIGLGWLEQFMGYCSDCTIDAFNQHWYNSNGNDVENFKQTVEGAAKYGPVFVGEFGAIGSDEEISSFIGEVMDWMDGNDNVLAYAYFMAYEGLLVNGDSLSPYGETYCNGN